MIGGRSGGLVNRPCWLKMELIATQMMRTMIAGVGLDVVRMDPD
jgi:hypothetical protein